MRKTGLTIVATTYIVYETALGSPLALDTAELLDHSNTTITPRHYELGVFPALAAAPVVPFVAAIIVQYRTQPVFGLPTRCAKY